MTGTVEGIVLVLMIVATVLLLVLGDSLEIVLEWLLSRFSGPNPRHDERAFQALQNTDQVAKTNPEPQLAADREREVRLPLFDNREEF